MTLLTKDSTDALETARGLLRNADSGYTTQTDNGHDIIVVADGDEVWEVRQVSITAPGRSLKLSMFEGKPADGGPVLRRVAPQDVLEALDAMLGTAFSDRAGS